MEFVKFYCQNLGWLKLAGNTLHDGHDFVVQSNAKNNNFDYLVFMDSRGVSREFEKSLAHKIISKIDQLGKTYLLICRPLNLTIWATLIGFIKNNQINPQKIITNMGFVDFTPKKLSIVQEALKQVEMVVGGDMARSYFSEDYFSKENVISLYGILYGDGYRIAIENIAAQFDLVIINTPLTDGAIRIERERPQSFFHAQAEANKFNSSIKGAHIIEVPSFDELLTYDAVHYTLKGNEIIFKKVESVL